MSRLVRFPSRVVLVLVVVGMLPLPRAAASPSRVNGHDAHGVFWTVCYFDHAARDDPIVFPGKPGASHLHDFFGNATTAAGSSRTSMAGGPTRCQFRGDRSAYWSPAAYFHGIRLPGHDAHPYYMNFFRHAWVHPFPLGLQMIGGNRDATSPAENPHAFWSCGDISPKVSHPYECSARGDGHVVAGVDFPSCWNGDGKGMDDVVYPPVLGKPCPREFPVALPLLSLRMVLGIVDPCAGATPCGPRDSDENVAISLASGAYYTLHADFWNFWSPPVLRRFVRRCLDAHKKCMRQIPPATIPSPPRLSASPQGGNVLLRWTTPLTLGPPATTYRIYRSRRPAAENDRRQPPIAVLGAVNSYLDTHVRHHTRYFYRVVAANSLGYGGLSDEASVRAP